MDLAQLEQEVSRLRRVVDGLLARGTISGGVLSLHLGGEFGADARCLPYGFASTPEDGTEVASVVRGDAATVVGDLHEGRPSTAKGAWTLYDRHGHTIASGEDGIVIDCDGATFELKDGKVLVNGATGSVPAEAVLVGTSGATGTPCARFFARTT